MGKTVAAICAALLAVWGLYCLLRMVEWLFRPSRPVVPAVLIRDPAELEVLDLYLDEALRRPRARGSVPPVLIDRRVLASLPDGRLSSATLALLRRFGTHWYAVELEGEESPEEIS